MVGFAEVIGTQTGESPGYERVDWEYQRALVQKERRELV